jgi:hypothetical protein
MAPDYFNTIDFSSAIYYCVVTGACPTMRIFDVTENENLGFASKGRSASQKMQALIVVFNSEVESLG